jgi:class 3 adenylate cyclase
VLGLGLAAVFASGPAWWVFGEPDWPLHIHALAVGLSLVAGGWIASRWRSGRAIARLMLLSACVFFISFIGYFGLGGAEIGYVIGIVTDGVWLAVAGHMVVVFPEGRLRLRSEKAVVGGIYFWTAVNPLPLFTSQPSDWGCLDCPRNILQVVQIPEVVPIFRGLSSFVPLLMAAAVMLLLVRRWHRATRPERRVLVPVFVAMAINIAAALVFYATAGAHLGGLVSEGVYVASVIVQRTAILLLPLSFGVGILRGILARSAAANLLVRIGRGSTADEIERDVAWALGDPSVRLALRGRHGSGFVAVDGRPLDLSTTDARSLTMVEGELGTAAALIHDPSLARDQPDLLETAVGAVRLALDNQHLRAEVELERELPVGLAERLQRDGARIGDTRTLNISVLMSDIRGYTTLAEKADLHELAFQLNEHRAAMNGVIIEHGGTVMQFVGDMVFAVFGAPVPTADHARRAVDAALAMQSAQGAINKRWRPTGRQPFGLGIAVTTGDVAAALLGSTEHVEYSVVGDVVNLAQRLQGWAAAGDVVISQSTHEQIAGNVHAERLPTALVKGRRTPVTAYRVATAAPTVG